MGAPPVSPLKRERKKRPLAHHTGTKSSFRKMFSQSSMLKCNLKIQTDSKESDIPSSDLPQHYSYWTNSWNHQTGPQQPDKQLPIRGSREPQRAETLIRCIDSTQSKCRKLIYKVSLSNCVYGRQLFFLLDCKSPAGSWSLPPPCVPGCVSDATADVQLWVWRILFPDNDFEECSVAWSTQEHRSVCF